MGFWFSGTRSVPAGAGEKACCQQPCGHCLGAAERLRAPARRVREGAAVEVSAPASVCGFGSFGGFFSAFNGTTLRLSSLYHDLCFLHRPVLPQGLCISTWSLVLRPPQGSRPNAQPRTGSGPRGRREQVLPLSPPPASPGRKESRKSKKFSEGARRLERRGPRRVGLLLCQAWVGGGVQALGPSMLATYGRG